MTLSPAKLPAKRLWSLTQEGWTPLILICGTNLSNVLRAWGASTIFCSRVFKRILQNSRSFHFTLLQAYLRGLVDWQLWSIVSPARSRAELRIFDTAKMASRANIWFLWTVDAIDRSMFVWRRLGRFSQLSFWLLLPFVCLPIDLLVWHLFGG